MFSFEQSLEQLKQPWSSESTFSVLSKSVAIEETMAKIQEKWTTVPLLCQRQIMIMLANELDSNCSLSKRMEVLASFELSSKSADEWLHYLVSPSSSTAMLSHESHQPLFYEPFHLLERTSLPDESVVFSISERIMESSADVIAQPVSVSKTAHLIPKPSRCPTSALVVPAIPAAAPVEVYKPKNIAELVDFDPEEPLVKKGPQKKKRSR
jgi:hypothetical protein